MRIRGKVVGFFDRQGRGVPFKQAFHVLVAESKCYTTHRIGKFTFVPHIGQKVIDAKTNMFQA
jgi:hypothetical protein